MVYCKWVLKTKLKGSEKMTFNYSKLRGRIKEKFGTQDKFADGLQIGRVSLSQRLTNKLEFSQSEIVKSCELLDLDPAEIPNYFFDISV